LHVSGQVSQYRVGNGLPASSTGEFRMTSGCPWPQRATTEKGMAGSRPSWAATA